MRTSGPSDLLRNRNEAMDDRTEIGPPAGAEPSRLHQRGNRTSGKSEIFPR